MEPTDILIILISTLVAVLVIGSTILKYRLNAARENFHMASMDVMDLTKELKASKDRGDRLSRDLQREKLNTAIALEIKKDLGKHTEPIKEQKDFYYSTNRLRESSGLIMDTSFLHRHIGLEIALGLDDAHVIVDIQDWVKARDNHNKRMGGIMDKLAKPPFKIGDSVRLKDNIKQRPIGEVTSIDDGRQVHVVFDRGVVGIYPAPWLRKATHKEVLEYNTQRNATCPIKHLDWVKTPFNQIGEAFAFTTPTNEQLFHVNNVIYYPDQLTKCTPDEVYEYLREKWVNAPAKPVPFTKESLTKLLGEFQEYMSTTRDTRNIDLTARGFIDTKNLFTLN